MELIDRYLNAVEFWLPSAQRADVVEELSDDLRSQVDEREAATGRALDESAVVEMLKQSGHPLAVAGKYLPQQYLIGPALLPLYRFFLKVFVLWILVPVMTLIVAPAAVLGGENPIAAPRGDVVPVVLCGRLLRRQWPPSFSRSWNRTDSVRRRSSVGTRANCRATPASLSRTRSIRPTRSSRSTVRSLR